MIFIRNNHTKELVAIAATSKPIPISELLENASFKKALHESGLSPAGGAYTPEATIFVEPVKITS